MTTYIILNTLFSIITILTIGWLVYRILSHRSENHVQPALAPVARSNDKSLDWKIYACLIIAFLLILTSMFAPFVFTRASINDDFNFTTTGQIGDTIGGLMNPFIALAGVIVTGLAFYIQYKANQQQRELFEKEQEENKAGLQAQINHQKREMSIQQFESQFYEMLRLHRENVTEMRINGYDFNEQGAGLIKFDKTTEGRKIFVTMHTELEVILKLYKSVHKRLTKDGFAKCYDMFFSGLDAFEQEYPDETELIKLARSARKRHSSPDSLDIPVVDNEDRKSFQKVCKLYFNYKPFSGHASRLGHYFRHLFLMVKSVANSDLITEYEPRMKYLRILRAQLSNHEQILLFYNWLSDYGQRWENAENSFFTEYCMIHNLWYNKLLKDDLIEQEVNDLRTKKVIYRTGKMFEIDE